MIKKIYFSLISILVILGASCSGNNPTDKLFGLGSIGVPTPTDLQLSIVEPAISGLQAGWRVFVRGSCNPAGGAVTITTLGQTINQICSLSGQFYSDIDISSAPLGTVTISAYVEDDLGDRSTVSVATFNKITTACDSATDRSDRFANFSTGGDGGAIPWVICTRQQMQNVNLNRADNFIVQSDINYEGNIHLPYSAYYTGDFDGANFTIRNMILASAGDQVGIFSQIRGPANIHDLNLDGITVAGRNRVAPLVGWVRENVLPVSISNINLTNINASGSSEVSAFVARVGRDNGVGRESFATISNINISDSSASGSSYVSGAIGYVPNTLGSFSSNNIIVSNTEVNGSGSYVGSIIGRMDEPVAVMSDFQSIGGSVTVGVHYGGGLIGEMDGGSLTNFNSTTDLTANGSNRSYFAGLIGIARVGAVLSGTCTYAGTVLGNDNNYVGGLVGWLDDSIILDGCIVDATVSGRSQIGGAVGRTDPFAVVRNIDAAPAITKSVQGLTYVGGLIGYFHQDGVLQNSVANSSVSSDTDYAGGAVGYHRARVTVDSVFASGNVSAIDDYAGGLMGGSSYDDVVVIESGASGNVSGDQFIGGLVGRIRINGISDFTNNFSVGNVRGDRDVGGLIGYIHRNVANIANKMYTVGRVTKIIGATGGNSSFGAIAGRSNSATAFVNTSLFYDSLKDVLDEATGLSLVGQNTYGTGVSDAALATQLNYTTLPSDYTFPVWSMPAPLFTLPGTNSIYIYPVLDWM